MLSLLTFASLAASALAHGGVLSYANAGNWYWGWQPYDTPTGQTSIERPWSSYNPITDATNSQMACNDDGTSGALQLTANVAAGSKITAYWNNPWPHPYGPMFTYLASCGSGSCTGVNANSLQWFKIDGVGLVNGTIYDGVWGDGIMINQNSSWTSTIPASVPSGNYLIRFETIALHSLPAQFYPECAQINISGGGSLAPTAAELCEFPGCYSNSDPGLTVDIYSNAAQSETTYPMPGPPLYAGATPSFPSQTGPLSGGSSASASASSTAASSTGTASSGTVTEYGQCGGEGWTGATACVAPYTCQASSAYYSQCLPA